MSWINIKVDRTTLFQCFNQRFNASQTLNQSFNYRRRAVWFTDPRKTKPEANASLASRPNCQRNDRYLFFWSVPPVVVAVDTSWYFHDSFMILLDPSSQIVAKRNLKQKENECMANRSALLRCHVHYYCWNAVIIFHWFTLCEIVRSARCQR